MTPIKVYPLHDVSAALLDKPSRAQPKGPISLFLVSIINFAFQSSCSISTNTPPDSFTWLGAIVATAVADQSHDQSTITKKAGEHLADFLELYCNIEGIVGIPSLVMFDEASVAAVDYGSKPRAYEYIHRLARSLKAFTNVETR